MYIPEFWCGVFASISIEIALLIVIAIRQGRNKK